MFGKHFVFKLRLAILLLASLTPSLIFGQGAKKVIGFSQIGSESGWRVAVSTSVKDAFEKAGFVLKFSDAQQKQENQIKALKLFIAQKVDLIVLAPVVQSGWESILTEIKDAKIPLIIANRTVKLSSGKLEDFSVTTLAPDNVANGRKAARWMLANLKDKKEVNVVELEGTVGSGPSIDRKTGFDDTIKSDPRFTLYKSISANFTLLKGKEVMADILKSAKAEGKRIDAVFAHNDDMGLGAIQAIKEANLIPGKDILIVSHDGVKTAFEAMVAGELSASVENAADYGTPLVKLVNDYFAGKKIPSVILVENTIFTQDFAKKEIGNRKY